LPSGKSTPKKQNINDDKSRRCGDNQRTRQKRVGKSITYTVANHQERKLTVLASLLALCDNIKCNSNSLNCANHENIKPYPLWLLVYFKKEIIIMQRDDVLL
jgi:hypothetical protein